MSNNQSFAFDIFNNTNYTLNFTITGNLYIIAPPGPWQLAPNSWLSAQNNNAPQILTLNGNDSGSLNFSVQVVGAPAGQPGAYVLSFDGTPLTSIPGVAYYYSANDLGGQPLKINEPVGVSYIFPLLYMNMLYNGNSVAVLMMVEALGASADLSTPYGVG